MQSIRSIVKRRMKMFWYSLLTMMMSFGEEDEDWEPILHPCAQACENLNVKENIGGNHELSVWELGY